jgi:hypothetical protein
VTPNGGRKAQSDITVQGTEEGVKGGKKRRKQRLQWVTAVDGNDGDNDEMAGSSGALRDVTTVGGSKCQARPPADHFERLLEEVCSNHAYLIKHKLKDCDMMKKFMVSGSLTRGMELDEVTNAGNMMPFLEEDAIMMICDGHPLSGMRRVSNLSSRTLTHCGSGHGDVGV